MARERFGPHDRGIIDHEPIAEPIEREPAMRELATRHEAAEEYEPVAETERRTVYSASGMNIIAGLWLIIAPAALGYAAVEAALWNSVVVGIAVAVLAIIRVARPLDFEGVSWTNFVLGMWIVISPFVLGLWDVQALVWNNIIVGLVVLALAATSARATRMVKDGTPGHVRSTDQTRRTP